MNESTDSLRYLQAYIETHIPLTGAMGIRATEWGTQGLALRAPFAPNKNDKNTAFGGSLSVMVTLAGWALTFLFLRDAGIHADVVVRRTRIEYRRPLRGALVARCRMPDEEARQEFLSALGTRGRARWDLSLEVTDEGEPAVTAEGTFVALV